MRVTMPGSPEGEQPRPLSSDQSKPSVEGGKSPLGLPSAPKDQSISQREHTPTPPDFPTRKQPSRNTSDLVLNSVLRQWREEEEFRKKNVIFKEITKGKSFDTTPEGAAEFARALGAVWPDPDPSEVKEPTPEELDRMAEEELSRLKSLKTMTERIDHALDYGGLVARMARLDPEFMAPIERGLERRDAVLEKKLQALKRIYQRRGWDNPQGER
jgi:hypothetical protein